MSITTFEVRDRCAYITLNRPDAMNALNPELRHALSQHFDEVEHNPDIWLAVITGAGDRAFCAGADLKHRAREAEASEAQRQVQSQNCRTSRSPAGGSARSDCYAAQRCGRFAGS